MVQGELLQRISDFFFYVAISCELKDHNCGLNQQWSAILGNRVWSWVFGLVFCQRERTYEKWE